MPAAPCAWPAAVSPMGDALLAGPAAEARVLAAFPAVLYLQLGRHEDVLPVLAADALRLPTGMCLARRAAEICWGVSAGDVVQVGAGRVRLPQADVVAVRRLRPERVAGTGSTPVAAMVRAAASICNLRLHAPLRADCADLTRAALAGRPVHHQVARLVGAGPG
ncbi:MAG TPA: hypothetical protein VFJ94_10555, partial [Intrasporangium sp.]|uniref:hypothetical protein n=1 Tax=Intrasporangium sp. TaxID=1925024 RepID=UPI002D76722E